jgi:hypothetical protein
MKQKKEKKQKTQKNQPLPLWIGGMKNLQQTDLPLFMNIAVRFALLCMATVGIVLFLIQTYDIPVNTGAVVLWTSFFSILFNVSFIFLKFRYAFPLFGLFFLIYLRVEDVLFNLGCIIDYMLVYVDGGMLYTANYASRPVSAITRMTLEFQEGIQKGLLLFAVFFALVFAIAARGKFIGSILITGIVLLIPAIASQNATYVPAMTLLAASMLGLYSIWASQEQSFLRSVRAGNKKRYPLIPQIHRHSVNGLATFCLALVAAFTAQALLPAHRSRDIIEFWSNAADRMIERFENMGSAIGGGFRSLNIPTLDSSGFMPGGGINAAGTMSVSNPTISKRPVLNVTLDSNQYPLYLRNGIGSSYDAERERWNVEGRTNRMSGFPDNFYPEHEYLVFRQRATNYWYTADSIIGRQQIGIEYLVRTPHVMLPTSPYLPDYKEDNRFNWRNDATLEKRGSNNPQTYTWDVLYPKGDDVLLSAISAVQSGIITERALTASEALQYGLAGSFEDYIFIEFIAPYDDEEIIREGAQRIFVSSYGLSAAEYLHYLAEYERMVFDVFTEITLSESVNMQAMLNIIRNYYALYFGIRFDGLSDAEKVSMIEEYFKQNFDYSLTVDNHSGDNSYLGNFLFETQSGHCALYATAMTLMLRELGIPARYVTGYVAGGANAEPAGSRYVHQILERDIHAWVEVYFKGVGWIPFDPTPPIFELVFIDAERHQGTNRPATTPRITTTPIVTTTPVIPPMTDTTPTTTPPDRPTRPTGEGSEEDESDLIRPEHEETRSFVFTLQMLLIAVVVLLTGAIVFAVIMFLKGLNRAEQKRLVKYADLQERETAREAYRFILKLLAFEGLTAAAGETPVKFAVRVDEEIQKNIPEAGGLSPAINAIRKLEFSKETLNAAEYASLSATTLELYRQVVSGKKAWRRLVRRVAVLGVVR